MTFSASVITLPAQAWRRSYVVEAVQGLRYGLEWRNMLAKLDPAKARRLNPVKAMDCYEALFTACSKLFPMFEIDMDYGHGEGRGEWNVPEFAWSYGITLEAYGLNYEDLWDGGNTNWTGTTLCAAFSEFQELPMSNEFISRNAAKLEPFTHRTLKSLKPGRSRQWRKPWGDIGLLMDYAHGNTGYAFLDWSDQDIVENGEYPRWNIDEIRGLAKDWKEAEPRFKRIRALEDYISAKPDVRLPLLAGALTGDAASIAQMTEPKPGMGKTLAQIFSRGQ